MNCSNCNNPLNPDDLFCSQCGQKVSRGRQRAREFLKEGWNEFVRFDRRFFRTMLAILIPGKLTTEITSGRRARYIKPVKLYIGFSIIAISLLNFLVEHNEDFFDFDGKSSSNIEMEMAIDSQLMVLKNQMKQLSDADIQNIKKAALEKLNLEHTDSVEYSLFGMGNRSAIDIVHIPVLFSKEDFQNLNKAELFKKYGITSWLDIKLLKQQFRFQDKEGNYVTFIIQKIGICILIMLPFLALFLKLIYVRNDFYYSEHLIFSLNIHSFLFMLTSVVSTIYIIEPALMDRGDVMIPSVILFVFYLFLSLKLVYKQSIFKTTIKFLIINLAYFYLAAFFFATLALISFLFF